MSTLEKYLDFDNMRKLTEDDITRISNWKAYEKPLNKIMNVDSICPTITTRSIWNTSSMKLIKHNNDIYCLGAKENLKLMGFDDNDYNNALEGGSLQTIAHTAGNSIVVDVLESIFLELFEEKQNEN